MIIDRTGVKKYSFNDYRIGYDVVNDCYDVQLWHDCGWRDVCSFQTKFECQEYIWSVCAEFCED